MRTAFQKVRRDLWVHKGRTILVLLSIAGGVLALGMTYTSDYLLKNQLSTSHQESNPSHAWMYLNQFVERDMVPSLGRIEGIDEIEGFTDVGIRWKASFEDEWQDGRLIMIDDYEDQGFDQFELKKGSWPTGRSVSVEFNHVAGMGAPDVGQTVYFEVNERSREISVGGTLRDPFQFPPPFGATPAFYVTRDMMRELTGVEGYSNLRITLTDYSTEQVFAIGDQIDEKLVKIGSGVGFVQELPPDEHFLQEMITAVSLILTVMAFASLGLSTILVINTMNALIAQQVPQIGIMKAIGGEKNQIIAIYMAGVFIYGVLSLVVAVPLGALAGNLLANYMLVLLNVPRAGFVVLPWVLGLQIFMGLLTPLLAALYPVIRGTAIEVAQALNQQGLGAGHYGARWLDQLLAGIRGMPRLVSLFLRNTFRRPGRVILTLFTLTAAGAIFMMVISTRHSFISTIDIIFQSFGFEVMVGFEQNQRIDEIIPMIESRPNVELAEMWAFLSGNAWIPGETGPGSKHEIFPRGVPQDSQLFDPNLVAGRKIHPDDGQAILLNQKLARRMGIEPGDQIVLELGGQESVWTVVGLVFDLGGRDQDTAFVSLDALNVVLNRIGQGSVVEVRGFENTLEMQRSIEKDLYDYLESKGIGVSFTDTALESKAQATSQFNVLTTVLMIMTILMGAVGSLGLSGTLSINVIERRREIGVMRAVGASSQDVVFVFSGEGLMLGLISWILATPLGLLLGPVFVSMVSEAIDFPAQYIPSYNGIWFWLIIVVVLSLVASWMPARRATQISVNESLAYE